MGLIHHVLITNLSETKVVYCDNAKIFSKFYDNKTDEEKFKWECKINELTRDEWHLAKSEKTGDKGEKNEKIIPQVATYDDKFIVYSSVGDLMVFLTGSEEYDELTLESLRGFCKKGVTESAVIEQYHKLCLYLDEIIKAGFLDVLQYERIYSYVHMKYDQASKK